MQHFVSTLALISKYPLPCTGSSSLLHHKTWQSAPPHSILPNSSNHCFTPDLQKLNLFSFLRLATSPKICWCFNRSTLFFTSRLISHTVHDPHLLPVWVDPGWSHIPAAVDSATIIGMWNAALPDRKEPSSCCFPEWLHLYFHQWCARGLLLLHFYKHFNYSHSIWPEMI